MIILAKSPFHRLVRAGLIAMSLAAAFGLDSGAARGDTHTSYSVTLDANTPDVTDIFIYELYPTLYRSGSYSFQATGGATTTIVNPFNLDGIPSQSLLLGIVNGLPSDGAMPVDHLVMFLNPSVATTILDQNLSFSSLFPGTQESDIISTFEFVVRTASGTPEWETAYSKLESFLNSVHTMSLGTGAADGYFPGPDGSTPGEGTAIAFSDPQQIGTVTSHVIGASVPEPSSLALGSIGALAALGSSFCRRRRPTAH